MGLFDFLKKGKTKEPEENVFSVKRSNEILLKIFRKHGIECEINGEFVVLEKQRITACTKVFDRTTSNTKIIQLDVKLDIGLGRTIIESCAGFGNDFEKAYTDVWDNFLRNSFHVLLGAFFSSEYEEQIHRYQWVIGGNTYNVTISNIGVRGKLPEKLETKWLNQLEEMIQSQNLTHETHWVRLYYAQSGGEVYSREILLDNEIWTDVEPMVETFDFPVTDDFLSVRVFMVLQSNFDISRYALTMGWLGNAGIENVQEYLVEEGLSPLDAEKAEVFIPLAFGRVFLQKNTKAEFSDKAIIMDDNEQKIEISLDSEKFFVSAYRLAIDIMENGCSNYEYFKQLVLQSSEVNAYNNALNGGSKPEDLDGASFGSTVIYMSGY